MTEGEELTIAERILADYNKNMEPVIKKSNRLMLVTGFWAGCIVSSWIWAFWSVFS